VRKVAIIVAGGKGVRMNSDIPKQFILLNSTPVLMHTISKFSHLDEVILVVPKTQKEYWNSLCKTHNFNIPHTIVEGGKTRFHSVKNGLEKVDNNSTVAIHDGVRPLISSKLINSLITETKNGVGGIPILPVKDSIRKVEGENSIHIDKSNLFKVQTPQCFLSTDIKEAYTQSFSDTFTDDASVFESNGGRITTLLGEEKNLKITTKEDLKIAELFIQ
jgi:2-C-methyl-D-erythritol 4-phosphate cytidylyltransferase